MDDNGSNRSELCALNCEGHNYCWQQLGAWNNRRNNPTKLHVIDVLDDGAIESVAEDGSEVPLWVHRPRPIRLALEASRGIAYQYNIATLRIDDRNYSYTLAEHRTPCVGKAELESRISKEVGNNSDPSAALIAQVKAGGAGSTRL